MLEIMTEMKSRQVTLEVSRGMQYKHGTRTGCSSTYV